VINADKEHLRFLFTDVKHYFNSQIGEFTHKRVTDKWYYHSMAFVREDLGYLFGFTVGVFRMNENSKYYDTAGINIVARTDGKNPEFRSDLINFIKSKLPPEFTEDQYFYTQDDRGGNGIILPKYRKLSEFESEQAFIKHFEPGIDIFKNLLVEIHNCPTDLFRNVVRAHRPWDEHITDFI